MLGVHLTSKIHMPFYTLGLQEKHDFSKFLSIFLVLKDALETTENVRKSAQLEPAVGYIRLRHASCTHLMHAIFRIRVSRTKQNFLKFYRKFWVRKSRISPAGKYMAFIDFASSPRGVANVAERIALMQTCQWMTQKNVKRQKKKGEQRQ